jgi:CRISPR-associated protein (TIGR03984 family)
MSKRAIQNINCNLGNAEPVQNPLEGLEARAVNGKFEYLLAHLDDGVVWGSVKNQSLKLSTPPELRIETLWEVRLFGETSEWHAWRVEDQWFACTVADDVDQSNEMKAFDEKYILWGTDLVEGETSEEGFYPVQEADLGIMHAPPIKMKNGRHTLKLSVRHYLDHDETGSVFVKLSRLMGLSNGV